MQLVFINKCISFEISNQISNLANKKLEILCFHFWKQIVTWHKYCKIKLFSGVILYAASNGSEAYLEPSQTPSRERFCENGYCLKVINY